MDPLLTILVARVLLLNTRNLIVEIKKEKSADGKVTVEEIPEIVINVLIKTLDELGQGTIIQELIKSGR